MVFDHWLLLANELFPDVTIAAMDLLSTVQTPMIMIMEGEGAGQIFAVHNTMMQSNVRGWRVKSITIKKWGV